jgi:glutathione peroxidase-family protein
MRKIYSSFIIFGIIILISIVLTIPKQGLSNGETKLCTDAIAVTQKIAKTTWKDFDISKVPIAIREANYEYVIIGGKVKYKRKPVFPIPVGSVARVKGKMNALVPSLDTIRSMGEFIDGGSSGNIQEGLVKKLAGVNFKISDAYYEGIIVHEAFHTYQIKKGLFEAMNKKVLLPDFDEDKFYKMIKKVSKNSEAKKLYEAEYKKTYELFSKGSLNRKDLSSLFNLINARKAFVKKNFGKYAGSFLFMEDKKESYEGSANYMVYRVLMQKNDIQGIGKMKSSFKKDVFNVNRYYCLGAMKCIILDRLSMNGNWNKELCKDWDINAVLMRLSF